MFVWFVQLGWIIEYIPLYVTMIREGNGQKEMTLVQLIHWTCKVKFRPSTYSTADLRIGCFLGGLDSLRLQLSRVAS